MATHVSYCRICQASCGLLVDIDDGVVTKIIGDRDNALSRGFTCPKGRRGGDFHHGPQRLTTSLRRDDQGDLQPVDVASATAEIAERLGKIIDEHGVDAVAIFQGTQSTFATLSRPFLQSWIRALGSHKHFSTMTIDQSAKWIVPLRMGQYLGGGQRFEDADVWLLSGTNPMVSLNAGNFDGPLVNDPSARIRDARRRGLKLIVIDPRRTETAARADLHLQPLPGHDSLVFAGLLHVILSEGLHDAGFCEQYVDGLDDLRLAVGEVTPQVVERRTGIPAADLVTAARIFGGARRGMVSTGTGVCMGPHSNVAEHLAISLNVVCGRYLRAGEPVGLPAMLQPMIASRADVAPPDRTWEEGFRSRVGGVGRLLGQLPSGILPDEILEPGPDRVRAMIVVGGNPVSALPDTERATAAFRSLDLLVTIDPRLTETAQLADFVIAPTLEFERADHTVSMEAIFPIPFAQYAAPLLAPPPGVIEDWRFLFDLAAQLGLQLRFAGRDLDMTEPPTSEDLLALLAERGRVPMAELRAGSHGVTAEVAPVLVAPRSPTSSDRLQLLPDDVRIELEIALGTAEPDDAYPLRLAVRRMREVMNSLGRDVEGLPDHPYNPAFMHPSELAARGLAEGQLVEVSSAHGRLAAVVHADAKVRSGVVSMTHSWGGPVASSDPRSGGSNVNRLLSMTHRIEAINRMPLMSGVPVAVRSLADQPYADTAR